jgi:hypothetical protein
LLFKADEMRLKIILALALVLLWSCVSYQKRLDKINRKIHFVNCNKETMKRFADSIFLVKYYDNINEFVLKIIENDSICTFDYTIKPKEGWIIKGGGGYISFSKRTCKIVKMMGHQ